MALAKEFGINDYPCPAGGCLLTDKGFSARLKDLLKYKPDYDISDLHLLKIGRHFRISDNLKLIVGRDSEENEQLMAFSKEGDFIFDILDIPSAVGLSKGMPSEKDIETTASIVARYSDGNGQSLIVSYRAFPNEGWKNVRTSPASQGLLESLRL